MLIDDTITEFGNSMEMPGLTLDDSGKIALGFEQLGTLFLEKVEPENYGDPELLIYLARDHGVDAGSIAAIALQACHYEAGHAQHVNAGLSPDGQLIFAIRLPEREVSLPSMESALQLLTSLHDSLKLA